MNWIYILVGAIILIGIYLFFYLSTRRKYRDATAAHNYEKIRNKVTVREEESEENESDYEDAGLPGMSLSAVISGMVILVIFLTIGGSVFSTVSESMVGSQISNVTTSSSQLTTGIFTLLPIFMILAIAVIIISIISSAFTKTIKGI